ncbi:MAG TPA: protein kinase, partial [Labilithrix sp.]|nr:protein kinase [Labilithrix sp.]
SSSIAAREQKHKLIGQTLGGRYRIKGTLGQGGMGTVYDAEHLGLSRDVAVKVLSPSQAKKRVAVKRFQQEARAAGAIGHPNICEVYDLGVLADGSPYLVMEKLVGQTLADRIAKEGGLPFEDVIEIVGQVLSGLIAAHEKGIVHRDIKPENIFLARRVGCPPIIKLLDFGVSKMMPEFQTGEDSLDLTRTGMVMGTPYYMSPEQARGERNLDGRVDVYACGVVMYEALAGKRPFLAPNYNALLLSIINTPARPLHELRPTTPPELEAIIERAMAKNRAERYPSSKHFLAELVPRAAARMSRRDERAGLLPHAAGARLPPPLSPAERLRAPVLGGRPEQAAETRAERAVRAPAAKVPARGPRPSHPDAGVDSANRPEKGSPPPAPREDLDSIDIPIHVTGPIDEDEDDARTAIFRPEKHLPPPAADDWENDTIVQRHDMFPLDEPPVPAPEPRPFNPEETIFGGADRHPAAHRPAPRRRR